MSEENALLYDVYLLCYEPARKIAVIKVICELTGCGLADAKRLSEKLPALLLEAVPRDRAEAGCQALREAAGLGGEGAKVRPTGTDVRLPRPPGAPGYRLLVRGFPRYGNVSFILALRELTGVGLPEARELAERPLPAVVATYATRAEAERGAAVLGPAAQVEILDPDAPIGTPPGPGPFSLVLTGYEPAKKIMVIKLIREATGVGLKEAKDLSEGALPVTLRSGVSGHEAAMWLRRFEGHGRLEARPE
jgi:large subunit ribosomal protein L7/L12